MTLKDWGIDGLIAENERLREMIEDACKVFDHYDLPEHAFHYRRKLAPAHEQSENSK